MAKTDREAWFSLNRTSQGSRNGFNDWRYKARLLTGYAGSSLITPAVQNFGNLIHGFEEERPAVFERLWMDLHLWLVITRFCYTIRSQSLRKDVLSLLKKRNAVHFRWKLLFVQDRWWKYFMLYFFLYILLLTHLSFFPGLFPAVLNLASMADITTNATCGLLGPEMFCKLVEHVPGQPVRNPQCRICNQRSVKPFGKKTYSSTPKSNKTGLLCLISPWWLIFLWNKYWHIKCENQCDSKC